MLLRRMVTCLVFLFLWSTGFLTHARKGDDLQIAVMTLGPYQQELYSAFGHTAIRVTDTVAKRDYVFNYGVFNFDQENFYWNFARGKMLYQLGLSYYDRFKNHYVKENRSVVEQVLNLTPEEKEAVYDYLFNNYKPENRAYYYNYVYDNCATKIPEILTKALPGKITFNYDYVREDITVRDLMDEYLTYQPWGDWIIDIGLGSDIDVEAPAKTYLFLPDYVMASLEASTITRGDKQVPLVAEKVIVFEPEPQTFQHSMFTPFNVFMMVFFVVGFITNKDFKKGKRTKWIDVLLFSFVGIIGWWCFFLWVGTVHISKNNWNLLWAIPVHIPLVYLLGIEKLKPILTKFYYFLGFWYILFIVAWGFIPQDIHSAAIPLALAMALRCFGIYFEYNKYEKLKKRKEANA